ncbi:hydrocephalus-inducing protein-like [Leptopilina boulardi]|uniref:hydrocephalus-inducing protein-like n=1 Tax=Leptopilina boulardi TaxID=63433 RepID=UPI0021F5AD53|nr:hydrocephalus-inducing protein-like [Leptopilina boulardi]
MIYFQPSEIGEITSVAYLEISGREDKLSLSLHGTCIGPNLQLSAITIDTGNIFVCLSHYYELTCSNNGLIPGGLIYKSKNTDFGGTLQVTPSELNLEPEDIKSFMITFTSIHKGQFVERIDFMIKESQEIISVYIRGFVVCPLLRFDREYLDFGKTAIGFTYERDFCIYNDSPVAVKFKLNVPDDGCDPPVTYKDFTETQIKPTFPSYPREIMITSVDGVICPQTSLTVKVHTEKSLFLYKIDYKTNYTI